MKPATKNHAPSPELAERFNRILTEVAATLEEAGIRYVFIGGIASHGLGRPRWTQDIDVFVRPEEAELALRAMAKRGFRTEKTDPIWLFKAWKDDILVDVIFKSKGEIYLDHEMFERMTTADYHGLRLKFVSPEDLILIKALAHSEATPGHWHDALALLSRPEIDWDYLTRRGRRAPRRLLSLLLYAQSSDVFVPKSVVDQLYLVIFGDLPPARTPEAFRVPTRLRPVPSLVEHDPNAVARLRERLAEDSSTHELDIRIEQERDHFLLRGEVPSEERRAAILRIAGDAFPGCRIESQIRVLEFPGPQASEDVK